MKKIFSILLSVSLLCVIENCDAQTISGVVNKYAYVTAVNSSNIKVNDASGFSKGDKVMIIQMKGAEVDTSNSAFFGDITDYGNAGNYEFAKVVAVSGNTVTVQYPLCRSYNIGGSVQLIKVPVYTNATISGTLTCEPWNGLYGGILAIEVTETLTMNADIDVSEKGFRGGINVEGGYNPFLKDWYLSTSVSFNGGGQKGEGVADYIINRDGGRGKLANGGGGSNPVQCGAGGGSNYGAGGIGGWGFSPYVIMYKDSSVQGIGGAALSYSSGKIFMGGGGGGGCADNGHIFTPGGNGAGIVIVTANSIIGNNKTIYANGVDVEPPAADEGAGGGGAGGTVLLNVSGFTGNLNVETKGGHGGDNYESLYFNGACHGTGGGGGGGILWLSLPSLPANLNYDGSGGGPGMGLAPDCVCYQTSWGAQAGETTDTPLFNLVLPPLPVAPVRLAPDAVVCSGVSAMLNPSNGPDAYTYSWLPADGLSCTNCANPAASPSVTTTYTVTGINGYCSVTKQITVTAGGRYNAGIISALRDTICAGTPASLMLSGDTGSVQWQSGVTASGSFSDLQGATGNTYLDILQHTTFFRVTAGSGACADTSEVYKIVVTPSPVADYSFIQNNTTVSFTDKSSSDVTVHEWNFGDQSPLSSLQNPTHIFPSIDTLYHVCLTVYNGSNCSYTVCKDIDLRTSTGINNVRGYDNWLIHPNPFTDRLYISSENSSALINRIEVTDVTGRTLIKKNLNEQYSVELNLSALPPNVYFIKIVSDKLVFVQPAIKH